MQKFSKRDEMLAAVPSVVAEDMKTWEEIEVPKRPQSPSFEVGDNDLKVAEDDRPELKLYRTPFGVVPGFQLQSLRELCEKKAKKDILARYGRSKYAPHQGAKECARRKNAPYSSESTSRVHTRYD